MQKPMFRRSSLYAAQSPEPRPADQSPENESPKQEAFRRTRTYLVPSRKPSFVATGERALPSLQTMMPSGSLPAFAPTHRVRVTPSATTLAPPEAQKYFVRVIPVEDSEHEPRMHRGQSQEPLECKQPTGVRNFAGGRLADTFFALQRAANLPRPSETHLNLYRIRLPTPRKPQTIVFGLEETLVHISEHKSSAQVVIHSASAQDIPIALRPHAQQCLAALHKHWEVIVFSSMPRQKVEAVLDFIDPNRSIIDFRLYQEHCLQIQGVFVKDLRLLSGRDLKRSVIVDNSPASFAFQIDNGIPIKTWRNNPRDKELLNLLSFTRQLVEEGDMRVKLRSIFDLRHFCADFAKAFKLSQASARPQG